MPRPYQPYRSLSIPALATLGTLAVMPAAFGQTTDDLQRQVIDQQAQIDELRDSLRKLGAGADAGSDDAGDGLDLGEISWGPAPEFVSRDGNFTMKIRGRIMVDVWGVNSDVAGVDLDSGAEFRRARLGVEGRAGRDWEYKAEWDFAGNDVSSKDIYIAYKGLPLGEVILGQHKEPFSLEELTSSRYITFLERALPNVFSPSRNIGVSYQIAEQHWTLAGGVFAEDDSAETDDQSYAVTGRVTWAPIAEKRMVLHIGGAASYRDFPGDETTLRLRERPEIHVFGTRLVDVSIPNPADTTKYGVEGAVVFGPASVQAEWIWQRIDSRDALTPSPTFNGGYVQASYFLTGESRPYSKGTFGRVKPNRSLGDGGFGAVEIAARYSTLDLIEDGFEGGDEDNFTVGLNWYVNGYMVFKANYVNFDVDDSNDRTPLGSARHEGDGFGLRAQIHW